MSDQTQGQGIDENGADAYATMQRAGVPNTPATPSASADDNSGAAPVMGGGIQEDNSGAAPVMAGTPPEGAPSAVEGINQEGQNQVASSAGLNGAAPGGAQGEPSPTKRIASMIMGEGAVAPNVLQAAAKAVDPANTQPASNQNLMALDAAVQKGDTKGAIALMQANRVAFMPKQALAYQATIGVSGKPADLNAAVANANEAEQHVLDGSIAKFALGDGGQITATVSMAGSKQPPQTFQLTLSQFQQYLNPKGDGQWDKLMNTTVPTALQTIASSETSTATSSQPAPQSKPGQTAPSEGETGGDEEEGSIAQKKRLGEMSLRPDGSYDESINPFTGNPIDPALNKNHQTIPQILNSGRQKNSIEDPDNPGHWKRGTSSPYGDANGPFPDGPRVTGARMKGGGVDMDIGETPSKAVRTGKAQAMDVTQADQPAQPGQFDAQGHYIGKPVKSFSDQQAEADQQGYGAELERRSRQIYPDVGHEAERQQWMAAQEDKELERKVKTDVATQQGINSVNAMKARNEGLEAVAGTRAGAYNQRTEMLRTVAKTKAEAAAQVEAAKGAREESKRGGINAANADRDLTAYWNTRNKDATINPLTPEEVKQRDQDMSRVRQRSYGAPQAPSGQPAPPPTGQAQRPLGVPPGAKQFQGKWYTRGPNGESVPVQ